MCDICKEDRKPFEFQIIASPDKPSVDVCPNCAVQVSFNTGLLGDIHGDFTSEISGKGGAVKVVDFNYEWFVTMDELQRLFGHSLLPNEYKALLKNHSDTEYLIHDDFYFTSGLAFQPVNEASYIESLSKYCEGVKDPEEKYIIEEYIKELCEG